MFSVVIVIVQSLTIFAVELPIVQQILYSLSQLFYLQSLTAFRRWADLVGVRLSARSAKELFAAFILDRVGRQIATVVAELAKIRDLCCKRNWLDRVQFRGWYGFIDFLLDAMDCLWAYHFGWLASFDHNIHFFFIYY